MPLERLCRRLQEGKLGLVFARGADLNKVAPMLLAEISPDGLCGPARVALPQT
jgi:hypothetical protein